MTQPLEVPVKECLSFEKTAAVLRAVEMLLKALDAAEKKHPEWPADILHAVAILNEESGEATKAANDYVYNQGSLDDVKTELAHTGAMAIRMLINLPG